MQLILSHTTALEAYRRDLAGIRSLLGGRHVSAGRSLVPVSFCPQLSNDDANDLNGRLGLSLPIHTLATGNMHFDNWKVRTHNVVELSPQRQCVPLWHGVSICSPEYLFHQMASHLGLIDLIVLGFEMCGRYSRVGSTGLKRVEYNLAPLTSVRDLTAYARAVAGQPGSRAMRQALHFVRDDSNSPKETEAALLLGLPYRMGGFNFGMPTMNQQIDLDGKARSIANGRGHLKCDLFFPENRLDIEYDSNEMHRDAGPSKWQEDKNRVLALKHMGIETYGLTNEQLRDAALTECLAKDIAKKLGKRIRPQCSNFPERVFELRRALRKN